MNYFNYFTEIEDHFQRARGTGLFLISPLDWALIEAWKNAGIPLEAVLRGIDQAFEKWRKRPARARIQMVNSLAYCAQAVATEAQAMAEWRGGKTGRCRGAAVRDRGRSRIRENECRRRFERPVTRIWPRRSKRWISTRSMAIWSNWSRRLTAIEEKMIARLRAAASEEALFEARRSFDADLKAYRSKMSADQLAMLEKQFLERKLLQASGLPRLSLFYLQP